MLLAGVAFVLGMAQDSYPPYSIHALTGVDIPGLPAVDGHLRVDQFGYLPTEAKVAVIADPVKGYNSWDHYTPGTKLQLRLRSGKPVYVATIQQWKAGAT